ncbi:MAG: ABC transporter ATP-binding protein [Acidobacteriota bacterium]|nr:ABC transporter ATP-binding protein [Acidobacteriota bacterium]
MTTVQLEVRNLRKAYQGFELGPLSETFTPGCIHGLLGPNGAGKTTLLNVLTLQTRATSGDIYYGGSPVRWGDASWKRRFAYVRETPSFYAELTVAETLRLAGRLYGRWDAALAVRMTARLGLKESQRVGTLSKGTRVKLGIVTALAQNAELLVLDEPTAGVDPSGREELQDILRDLKTQRPGLCVLLSSHIFEDIEAAADDVRILREGQIVFRASRAILAGMALFRTPQPAEMPVSESVRLAWTSEGQGWLLVNRDSACAARLRATPGCVEEPPAGMLAAVFRGTGKIAVQAVK